MRARIVALTLSGLVAVGCADPVHDNEVAALGGETPGVLHGPLHRPGQPCLVCHGGQGPGNPQFSVAGTVYRLPVEKVGLNGVTVKINDVNDAGTTATTNTAGNFYILASDYTPAWPFRAEVDYGTFPNPMLQHIGRDGACASCHFDPQGPDSPGHVYMFGEIGDIPDGGQ